MKYIATFFFAAVLLVGFSACQKEIGLESPIVDPNNPGSGNTDKTIPGTYDFVGLVATGTSAVSYTAAGIQISSTTYIDYKTKNNAGICVFTDKDIAGTNIKYEIDTTLNVVIKTTGIPSETQSFPFAYTHGPASANSSYTLKGTDSIVFATPVFSSGDVPNATLPSPSASHIGWSGDTLIFTSALKGTYAQEMEGIPVQQTINITSQVKLKKK